MSTTYDADLQRLAESTEQVNRAMANNKGLGEVYRAFPQITPNLANTKMMESYCSPDVVNLAAVQFAFENGSDLLNQLALRDDEQARLDFINIIVTQHNGGQASKEFIRKSLNERFRVGRAYEGTPLSQKPLHSTSALQAKADEVTRRAQLRDKSPAELREIIQQGSPRAEREHVPAHLTRKFYAALSTENQRRALQRYSAASLNTKWANEEK